MLVFCKRKWLSVMVGGEYWQFMAVCCESLRCEGNPVGGHGGGSIQQTVETGHTLLKPDKNVGGGS